MGILANFLDKISNPLIFYHAGSKNKIGFFLQMAQAYSEIIATRDIALREADKLIDIIHANIASVYFDDQTANRTEYLNKTIQKVIQQGTDAKLSNIAIAFIITSITTTELQLDQVGYIDISEAPPPPGKSHDNIEVKESPDNTY